MRYLILLLLLLLTPTARADSTNIVNTTLNLFVGTSLAASASATATVDIDRAAVFGMSWSVTTTGTPSVGLLLRYANSEADTHVVPVSVDGTQYTSTVTISNAAGMTDMTVPGAKSFRVTATNNSAVPATLTLRLFKE